MAQQPSNPTLFDLALVAGGAVALYLGHTLAGMGIFLGFVYFSLARRVGTIEARSSSLALAPLSFLSVRFSIPEALDHESVGRIFSYLRNKQLIEESDVSEWRSRLATNFNSKYGRSDGIEQVTFSVNGPLLFKNERPTPHDYWICHEVDIPYDLDKQERPYFSPEIDSKLTIRVAAVNGMLVLQLGRFSKDTSPLLNDNGLAVYQTYDTLSSFPLMHFTSDCGIPLSFLGLTAKATKSYREYEFDRQRSKTRLKDWRQVQADAATYQVSLDWLGDVLYPSSKQTAAIDELNARGLKIAEENGFRLISGDSSESWRWPDRGKQYTSRLMEVAFQNMNNQREFAESHWYLDYYKEMP